MYYVESAGSIGIVRFAFHGANGLISDAFVVSLHVFYFIYKLRPFPDLHLRVIKSSHRYLT